MRAATGNRTWITRATLIAALFMWFAAAPGALADTVLIVLSSEAGPYREASDACQRKLKSLGHGSKTALLADVQKKGVDKDVTAVIALGTPAAAALHQSLDSATPLFYAMVAQPASSGLTSGRSTVGISTDVSLATQMKWIADALPKGKRVGVLYRSNDEQGRQRKQELEDAMPAGWTLAAVAINDYDSPAGAIDALLEQKPAIIWTEADAGIFNAATIRTLLLAGLRKQTPVFGFSSAFVKAGALLGVNIEAPTQGEHVAELTHQMLSGKGDPSSRIVEPRFQVALNLIVAKTLKLSVPSQVEQGAEIVFKE